MHPETDITNVRLETKRLILRAWKQDDLSDFYEYARVPGVGEMAGWPHHESIETTKMILESFINEKNVFAIEHRETGKVIGSLGLHNSWANGLSEYAPLKLIEIGYVLSKDFWGQGLMPEAVKAVIRYAFDEMKLDALTVCHFTSNTQSKRVIEKSGFIPVGTGVYHAKQLGTDFDDIRYILKNPVV